MAAFEGAAAAAAAADFGAVLTPPVPTAGLLAPAVDVDAAGARRAAVDATGARVVDDVLAELDDIDEGVAPRLQAFIKWESVVRSRIECESPPTPHHRHHPFSQQHHTPHQAILNPRTS